MHWLPVFGITRYNTCFTTWFRMAHSKLLFAKQKSALISNRFGRLAMIVRIFMGMKTTFLEHWQVSVKQRQRLPKSASLLTGSKRKSMINRIKRKLVLFCYFERGVGFTKQTSCIVVPWLVAIEWSFTSIPSWGERLVANCKSLISKLIFQQAIVGFNNFNMYLV